MTDEPPALPPRHSFDYVPMDEPPTIWSVISALLKQPGQVVYELLQGRASAVLGALALVAVASLALYGVVVGSLAGGAQYQHRNNGVGSANQLTLSGDYFLSKRTDVYFVAALAHDHGFSAQAQAALGDASGTDVQTAVRIGIRHKF